MLRHAEEELAAATRVTFPRAVREQAWIYTCGRKYSHCCPVPWCTNEITVFDFHMGHIVALAHGGSNSLENLIPLCARCNLGMGRQTLEEWCQTLKPPPRWRFLRCLRRCHLRRRMAHGLRQGARHR